MERERCKIFSHQNCANIAQNTFKSFNNKRKNKRKKRKNSQKFKNGRVLKKVDDLKQNIKGNSKFVCTMTSWAENYSKIVSWQSKHQIAYWKAKATALEHENKILHEIIRKNRLVSESSSESSSECEEPLECYNIKHTEANESDDMEVSQEYIDFLVANSKYREDARREREKFRNGKLTQEEIIQKMEEMPITTDQADRIEEARALYGDNYKYLVAQEMSLDSKILVDKDKFNPVYWPNTPFNS